MSGERRRLTSASCSGANGANELTANPVLSARCPGEEAAGGPAKVKKNNHRGPDDIQLHRHLRENKPRETDSTSRRSSRVVPLHRGAPWWWSFSRVIAPCSPRSEAVMRRTHTHSHSPLLNFTLRPLLRSTRGKGGRLPKPGARRCPTCARGPAAEVCASQQQLSGGCGAVRGGAGRI